MNALRLFGMRERLLAWEAVPENSARMEGCWAEGANSVKAES